MTAILDSSDRPVPSAAVRRIRMRAMYGDPATEGLGWPAFAYVSVPELFESLGSVSERT